MRCIIALLWIITLPLSANAGPPIVIAHRGASGYLPEHTLPAVAAAHAMNADYIEQDVVLTRDMQAIVLHDLYLDTMTDVQQKFPDRARDDGRYYAIDFTLEEIKQLSVGERVDQRTGMPAFPNRFPTTRKPCTIPTLAEELELIQGLNHSRNRTVGVYPEIKRAAWHREQGKDISRVVLSVLDRFGYQDADDAIYLQSFEQAELIRIRRELGSKLRLVQLIGIDKSGEGEFSRMTTEAGLREIAEYAQGIGPDLTLVISGERDASPIVTTLVGNAHQNGLVVHPYTFRIDRLPDFVDDWETLIDWFVGARVDGMFTDFPDRVLSRR